MTVEIKAPQFPESVEEGSIATWHKKAGDAVRRDELLVDIETDKTVLEVVASEDGVLSDVLKGEGDIVLSQEVTGHITPGGQAAVSAPAPVAAATVTVESTTESAVNPAAKKLIEEHGLSSAAIAGTGKDDVHLLVVMTSERGLCGGFNANIVKLAERSDVIAITYPVNIWDYLGWDDTFAKKLP